MSRVHKAKQSRPVPRRTRVFAHRPVPACARDLVKHDCIRLRLGGGGLYAWGLRDGDEPIEVRVDGQFTFNGVYRMLDAIRHKG